MCVIDGSVEGAKDGSVEGIVDGPMVGTNDVGL